MTPRGVSSGISRLALSACAWWASVTLVGASSDLCAPRPVDRGSGPSRGQRTTGRSALCSDATRPEDPREGHDQFRAAVAGVAEGCVARG